MPNFRSGRKRLVKKRIAARLWTLLLVACSGTLQPPPSATPTRTATVTPAPSPFPPTETPQLQPAREWNRIPIMAGAIAGEGDEESFIFVVKGTPRQVQEYYQLELDRLGWQLSAQSGDESAMTLTFTNTASEVFIINIISKGDESLVLLAK